MSTTPRNPTSASNEAAATANSIAADGCPLFSPHSRGSASAESSVVNMDTARQSAKST